MILEKNTLNGKVNSIILFASLAGHLAFSDNWVKEIDMLHEQRTQFKLAEI
jgi:hypothetical protein